jgi:CubicO group peptidase (beta-lactamase class C family)
MKKNKRWLLLLCLFFVSCKALIYNVPNVTDFKIFETNKIQCSTNPKQIPKTTEKINLPAAFLWAISKNENEVYNSKTPEDFLSENGTLSLIIIRNDTILYENYFNGFHPDSIHTIFSISKSFLSTLTGIAINEGYIKNINQPVSDFIPSFRDNGREKLTINHLLQMTSGINEADYDDLLKLAYFYYANDHNRKCEKVKMRYQPGTHFQYSSMTSQLLGMCLEKATGRKLEDYLKEKIWEPLGMQYNALVSTDKKGNPKYFGGISANPKDLAKLGLLYLKKGNWEGKQIVPESWIMSTQKRDTTNGKSTSYSNCFWQNTYPVEDYFKKNDFYAKGFGGQTIYVNPENNTVIVRTGTKEVDVRWGRSISKLSHFPFTEKIVNSETIAKKLIGTYKNKFGNEIDINCVNGKVSMKYKGEKFECQLEPTSDVTFEDKIHGRKIVVECQKDKIKGVILEEPTGSYYFSKK